MSDQAKCDYDVVEGWGVLPAGWSYGHVIGVAVDSLDRVYVFNRGEHPLIIFKPDGGFHGSWGEGAFSNPHGLYIDHDDCVYCTDSGNHTVKKFTTEGVLLKTWGTPGRAGENGEPFDQPADVAVTPEGYMYVADGYGNSRIHKFSPEGELILSWGEKGAGPGQFEIPHDVWAHTDGKVFVADRQNNRIQIFTQKGEFIEEWTDFILPCAVHIDKNDRIFVPELRARMTILDINGEILNRWGGEKSEEPGMFLAPHAAVTDSEDNLYVGETLDGSRVQKFKLK